ncbi:MAG: prolyl aminopeptidase [Pelagibacterales bacterium]|nr:prolyl aminopeptidase [Pelagibacterales bacterium]
MLYTIKKSFAIHEIKRDKHILYLEEYGNVDGIPILFLHGGPGSGCSDWQKSLFNDKIYRVIFLDQRGAGKSVPKRLLENNTILDLIGDIEYIRSYLKIDKWFLVGGSWGSTLAIAYAETKPSAILGMVLRSLFLGTKTEVDWAFRNGPITFKPNLIKELNLILKNKINDNPIISLGKMLESKNLKKVCIAAELWQEYEKNLSTIKPVKYDFKEILNKECDELERLKKAPNTPFLENHYIKNNFFLKNNQLLNNKKLLYKIPISVIQGEYDLLCPPINSFLFSNNLPKVKIIKAYEAGHYISDPGIKELMKKEIDELQYI